MMKRLITSFVSVLLLHAAVYAADLGEKSGEFFDRALVTKENVQDAVALEKYLQNFYNRLPVKGEAWFTYLPGTAKVLIVAPHATSPMRKEQLRFPDSGTGSLAIMLNRLAKAPVLYTSLASPSDPNLYDDNDFKRELEKLIKTLNPLLVIDLHGSDAYRPYDVDFGTMKGASLKDKKELLVKLADALRSEGILNFSQDYFPAEKDATDTKWIAARGVPAIQLEISSTWLSHTEGTLEAHRFAQLLQALTRFIIPFEEGSVKQLKTNAVN
jgi:hypothetical protein